MRCVFFILLFLNVVDSVMAQSPPAVNLGNDTVLCFGQSFTVNAGNIGSNYVWSTNETTQQITVSIAGKYEEVLMFSALV